MSTNTWTQVATHYVTGEWWSSLNGCSVVVHEGNAYIIGVALGNINNHFFLGQIRRFDPGDLSTTVIDTVGCVGGETWFKVGPSIYGLGGGTTGYPNLDFVKYDLETGEDENLDPPTFLTESNGLVGCVGVGHGQYGYVGYGSNWNSNAYFQEFWRFHPPTGEWTQVASMNQSERREATICSWGDCIYSGLGYVPDGPSGEIWRYCQPTSVPESEREDLLVRLISTTYGMSLAITVARTALLELFDAQGRVCRSQVVAGSTTIPLQHMAVGFYTYRVSAGGQYATGKVAL